jgi:nitrite reductase (NADH) small subunit
MEVLVGEQPYAICNVGGTFTALCGICPHQGGPLGQGQIHDGRLVCPYHLWEFDCRTGAYDLDPARRVATYAVRVEDGGIFLQVP